MIILISKFLLYTILITHANDFIISLHQTAKNNAELIVLQQYALRYFDEIVALLDCVPSDVLLLLKTNDCLRHLDKQLRTPVNSTTGKWPREALT